MCRNITELRGLQPPATREEIEAAANGLGRIELELPDWLRADVAVLGEDGRERRVAIGELQVGDRFVVRPGEKIATDGVVEEGSSAVDQALLTCESIPVEKHFGDEVVGGPVRK